MVDGFVIPSCEEGNGEDEHNQRYKCYQKHNEFLVSHKYPFISQFCAHLFSDGRIVLRVRSCEHMDRIVVRRPQVPDDDAALGA